MSRLRQAATRTGPASALPRCPGHLTAPAAREWRRVAAEMHRMGVLTTIDRAALAAYCQAWGRWVEAEERMREAPLLYKTPSGHVQQSPLLGIVNKQLELMGRYMAELGMTPSSRSRVTALNGGQAADVPRSISIEFVSPKEKLSRHLDGPKVAPRDEPGHDIRIVSWKEPQD